MANAQPEQASLGYIERTYQLDRVQIRQCLRHMQVYGAVEAFALDGDVLRVAINLSILRRLRVLQCRRDLGELVGSTAAEAQPIVLDDAPEWLPAHAETPTDDDGAQADAALFPAEAPAAS